MKQSVRWIALLCLCLCTGCSASKKALLRQIDADINALEPIALCGELVQIEFSDKREDVTDDRLRVPIVSRPGQRDEIRPPLTDELQNILQAEVVTRVVQGNDAYSVNVTVLEALQRFDASWRWERETVEVKTLVHINTTKGWAEAESQAVYFARSVDASRKYALQLYEQTLRFCVAQAFVKAAQLIPEADTSCK